MAGSVRGLWKDETGAVGVEYSILVALIAVVALVSWQGLGCAVSRTVFRAAYSALPGSQAQ